MVGYGSLRTIVLKQRKIVGGVCGFIFVVFLGYTFVNEGRPGKVRSSDLNHDGPDLFQSLGLLDSFDTEELERLAIGQTGLNPFDSDRAIENLLELEEEAVLRERVVNNVSVVNSKPSRPMKFVVRIKIMS